MTSAKGLEVTVLVLVCGNVFDGISDIRCGVRSLEHAYLIDSEGIAMAEREARGLTMRSIKVKDLMNLRGRVKADQRGAH